MPFRYAGVRLNGWFVTISLICVLLSGCGEPTAPFPKPSGWPRIDLPSHTYQLIRDENCPFSFEAPAFGQVESRKPDSCWMDLYFEKFQCRWHITYRYLPGSGHQANQGLFKVGFRRFWMQGRDKGGRLSWKIPSLNYLINRPNNRRIILQGFEFSLNHDASKAFHI